MKKLILLSPILAIVGVTILSGFIQGRMTDRWGPGVNERSAAELLESLPDHFGGWRIEDSNELSEYVVRTLQCSGYVARTYANPRTGQKVNVGILLGPPGPISVHTPEICYSSREYAIEESRERVTVETEEGLNGDFWKLILHSNRIEGQKLHVYYAWNDGAGWKASDSPRWDFAGSPFLYKIQLAAVPRPSADGEAVDPCLRFLRDLLPVAKRHIAKAHR